VGTEKYYKDLYFNELIKLKAMIDVGQHEQIKIALEKIISIK